MAEGQIKEMTLVMHGIRTEVTAMWNEEQNRYLVFPNEDIEELLNLTLHTNETQPSF